MTPTIDLVELAGEMAEIARTTTDADAAVKLLRLVERLLTEVGLPDSDADEGGGEPPPGDWRHGASFDHPEYA